MTNLKMNLSFLSVCFSCLKLRWFKISVSGPVGRKLESRTAWLSWSKVVAAGLASLKTHGKPACTKPFILAKYSDTCCKDCPLQGDKIDRMRRSPAGTWVSDDFSVVEAQPGSFWYLFGQLPSDLGAFGIFPLHSRLLPLSIPEWGSYSWRAYLAQNRYSEEDKE